MASDLRGYTEQETLNKVLNTDNDSIQVDIVDATGVTITTSNESVYADDADWTDTTSKHTLVGGLYQSTPQSITDGDVGPFQVDADGALHISDGGNTITVDGTVTANLSSTDNTVLDNILTKNTEIDAVLDTIKVDTEAIETAVELLDNAIDGSQMQVDVVAALPAGSNTIGVVDLGSTDNAVLDAMVVDLAAIEVLLTAANVDHAANEVLLGTIDSDTNDIKTATEASNTHLGNMFYDTALAVTPSDGSDLSGEPFYAVYVGTGGDLKVDMADGGSAVTLSNVASGQLLPIMVERIYSTGTTASNIIAFK